MHMCMSVRGYRARMVNVRSASKAVIPSYLVKYCLEGTFKMGLMFK